MGGQKNLRDVGRKVEAKRQHLKDMPFETLTPAQTVMRREMEAGVHKLRDVLEEEFGTPGSDPEVTELAHRIIVDHGEGLVLNFRQWAIVQGLVEAGIRAGRAS